jgi:hypothetical protein
MKYDIYAGTADIRLSQWLTVDVNSIFGLFRRINVFDTADASDIHLSGSALKKGSCTTAPTGQERYQPPLPRLLSKHDPIHTQKLAHFTHFDPEDGGSMYLQNAHNIATCTRSSNPRTELLTTIALKC